MIRYTATAPNGRRVIGLGLEAGNVERLMNGEPIFIKGESLGIPFDILIDYAATKNAMLERMRESGVVLPPEKEWKSD